MILLEKAIELVSDSAYRGVTTFNQDYTDAQKLLIEAGKWRLKVKHTMPLIYYKPLPGEEV